MSRWVGVRVIQLPGGEERKPLPRYLTPMGRGVDISGPAAESWPHPRQFQSEDGALFIEQPIPSESDWGITFHTHWPQTWPGAALAQYVEGRASGFPFWPTAYYALRATVLYRILRREAKC